MSFSEQLELQQLHHQPSPSPSPSHDIVLPEAQGWSCSTCLLIFLLTIHVVFLLACINTLSYRPLVDAEVPPCVRTTSPLHFEPWAERSVDARAKSDAHTQDGRVWSVWKKGAKDRAGALKVHDTGNPVSTSAQRDDKRDRIHRAMDDAVNAVVVDADVVVDVEVAPLGGSSSEGDKGSLRFLRGDQRLQQDGTVLILTILKDTSSFGSQRGFREHLDLLARLSHPKEKISLGFLVSNEDTYAEMSSILTSRQDVVDQYARVTLVDERNHFQLKDTLDIGRDDAMRHANEFQRRRRTMLARYRNLLLTSTLGEEEWVLWIDADITLVPSDLIERLLAINKDVITPLCMRGKHNYDLNAWSGDRVKPSSSMLSNYANLVRTFVPRPTHSTRHMDTFQSSRGRRRERVKSRGGDDNGGVDGVGAADTGVEDAAGHDGASKAGARVVPLDSVGGTVLLVRSILHRQGVVFPPYYVIGTEWASAELGGGWDGVETEGLCYVAKTMGYQCYGAPDIVVYHDES